MMSFSKGKNSILPPVYCCHVMRSREAQYTAFWRSMLRAWHYIHRLECSGAQLAVNEHIMSLRQCVFHAKIGLDARKGFDNDECDSPVVRATGEPQIHQSFGYRFHAIGEVIAFDCDQYDLRVEGQKLYSKTFGCFL